jgi:CubicO group peptidase (beta-lactamase class C family)
MHSMLVARRGKLVMEEYFHGYDRDMPHDTRSAGKTFASVMLGAVMREGVPISPETRVYQLLGGMGPFANPDPRKSRIALGHLMTHTTGLACDDYNDASPGNENRLEQVTTDWYKYTLDLPMAHEPGHRYAYCSANMNLMGAALTTATHTWLPELFARTVARPLQFGTWHWNLMPNGQGYLGGGSWLRPRDLLKVGQAYLDGGVWKGRRIVDSAWIAISTASRIKITPATTGLSEDDFGNNYGGGEDGLAWHLGGDQYFATGNGGQLLIVAPKQEMVVVFTGANYRQGWIWGRWGPEFMDKHFIPAIRD